MPVASYPEHRLSRPPGMEADGSWSLDSRRGGFEKTESGLNARAVDFAKLGLLVVRDGRFRPAAPAAGLGPGPDPGAHRGGRGASISPAGDDTVPGRVPASRLRESRLWEAMMEGCETAVARQGNGVGGAAVEVPSQGEHEMKLYLRGMDQPEGPIPPPEVLETISRDVDALNQEPKAAAVRGGERLESP